MQALAFLILGSLLFFNSLCFADPIPGGGGEAVITATVTGEVTANAGTYLNTSALATSAKQDTLLTELQLKADLTETQHVSIASVPSHAVTNAGTFAVQSASTIADGADVTFGA